MLDTTKNGTAMLKKGFSIFLSAIMAATCCTSTFAMRSAKKKQKEDDEPKPHMTRRYVRDELIHEFEIPIGDLDAAVQRVYDAKEHVYTSEFVLRDTVEIIARIGCEFATKPLKIAWKIGTKAGFRLLGVTTIRSIANSSIRKSTKKQLENVFKTAKNGIRVKTYYTGCWEEDCYCDHPFACALACADDFYGDSYVIYEAY